MKRLLPFVLGLACPGVALATDVMRVPLSSAVADIGLSPRAGVTISFIPTGHTIEKVWLDNPRWVVLDVDGCLEGLGKECDEKAAVATTIHLRRINPLSIEGLPNHPISLLTVITRDSTSNLSISTFRIVPKVSAQYYLVEVVPPAVSSPSLLSVLDTTWIERGRDIAVKSGWMRIGSPLYARIDQFLTLARTESLPAAAKSAGVSLDLIERLLWLGRNEQSLKLGNQP